jgi:hypothetical protein
MDDVKGFRKILFWVITLFFIVITLLTILNLFFGIGLLEKEYKSKLLTAFILEIAAALIALFYSLFSLKKDGSTQTVSQPSPSGILPAQKDVSEKEMASIVKNQTAEIYVGPQRSYTIALPPKEWLIKEASKLDITIEIRQIKNEDLINHIKKTTPDTQDVVLFQSNKKFVITPKPGETIINGSFILSALPFTFNNQLMIFPESRFRPPLYNYSSMESVLLEVLTQDQSLKVLEIDKINTFIPKNTNIKITEIELVQRLQNAILDDNEFSSFEIHHHFFGIEGELKHYVLQASYLEAFGAKDEAANDKFILFDIVNSFKPLRLLNVQEMKEAEKNDAIKKQREFFEMNGQQVFNIEIGRFLSQYSDEDLDNKSKLMEIKKGLKQFRAFANQIKFSDVQLDQELKELWKTIDKADQGDFNELKAMFKKILDEFNQGVQGKVENKEVEPSLAEEIPKQG